MSHPSRRWATRGAAAEPKLRVAPYLRASKTKRDPSRPDAGRHDTGKSINDQRTDYEASYAAHSKKWTEVDRFVDDNRSASAYATREREDFERLKLAIAAGLIDVLWLWEFSRAQRRLKTYAELAELCREHGVRWFIFTDGQLFDLDDSATRQLFGFKALMAEGEAEVIAERNKRGARANIASGRPYGVAAYGYKREYDSETKLLVRQYPDPQRAPIVDEISRRYAAGESLYSMKVDLDQRGVPTPTPGRHGWYAKVIKDIAINPLYVGKRKYRGGQLQHDGTPWPALIDGKWEPIVDAEIHEQCLRRAARPADRAWTRPARVKHLLSGTVARCGQCGSKSGPTRDVCDGKTYERFACRDHGCVSVPQAEAIALVEAVVLKWLARPTVAAAVMSPDRTAQVAKARERAAAARAELDVAKAERKAKRLSVAGYVEIEMDLLAEIERAEADERALVLPGPVANLLRSKGTARQRWDALDISAKRAVLQALWTIELIPSPSKRPGFTPDKIRMTPK